MTNTQVRRPFIPEDWTAVILAFLIIGLLLAGLALPSPVFEWKNSEELWSKVFNGGNLGRMVLQLAGVTVIGGAGVLLTGKSLKSFVAVVPVVYALTVAALLIAGNVHVKGLNLEAVIFSLVIGLLIGNLFKLPEWFRTVLTTELFVKIGLVMYGCTVLFKEILKAGIPGIAQSLIVVLGVWYFAWWICKKLKVDEEMSMMISSAVSICGVSAAIATAGAIKGDSKKLSYVISMVLITAIPMMLVMPWLAGVMGLSQEVTGAWLGGSIDTTGAVTASGTMVGQTALTYASVVKFSQNVLLGLAAFAISVYWTYAAKGKTGEQVQREKPSLKVIWDRFPKFVIGFLIASLLFSFIISPAVYGDIKSNLKGLSGLWFALAFTSIGLETNFADLFGKQSKTPLYAFLIAQLFNILLTLGIAYVLFS